MSVSVNAPKDAATAAASVASQPASQTAKTEGKFRGQRVQRMKDPAAELQDAAEELTFGASEVMEKKLSRRKLKGGQKVRTGAMEQAEKYLRQVADLEKQQKLEDFAKSLLARDKPPGPEEFRRHAEKFSDDDSHQYLALCFALEQASEKGVDPEYKAALEEAISSLEADKGPAIHAGLNVSPVAEEFVGKNIGDMQQMRDLYRDVVLDCETINDAYQRVVDDHPGKSFDEAVRFMLKALGADLAATTQSVSKNRIKQIMNDMYQLKSLNSVHEQCGDLIRRLQRNFDAEPAPTATRDLVSELLTAQDRAWQGADAFIGLPDKMGLQGDEAGIYFLQGFKELIRFLPLKAFGEDLTKRDRLMMAVQQSLDVAIENEEYEDYDD